MPGRWDPLLPPWPHRAIHLNHLKSGAFLFWPDGNPVTGTTAHLWHPDNPGTFTQVPTPAGLNLFCAGHSAQHDGKLVVIGGGFDTSIEPSPAPRHAAAFDPDTNSWTALAWMTHRRWYPTCTTLPDGTLAAFAGWSQTGPVLSSDTPEVFTPGSGGGSWTTKFNATRLQDLYPFMFAMPDGRLLDAGPQAATYFLNLATWVWVSAGTSPMPDVGHASAVMFDAVAGKILKGGGARTGENAAIRTTTVFNGSIWQTGPDMAFRRQNHNYVALPNGQVLCVGGCLYEQAVGNPPSLEPVKQAETFDPAQNTWTADPDTVQMTDPRWYHSTAGLMRDASVLTAGGDNGYGYTIDSAQIYRPAYLFDAAGNPAVRPRIGAGAPTVMLYNATCTIPYTHAGARPIAKASLTKLCSVTHGFDQDQRYVPLTITSTSSGIVTVLGPANANIAPPGWYMLWILDDAGVPCELAAYVRVGAS